VSTEQGKHIEMKKYENVGLNFILAGKWDVIPRHIIRYERKKFKADNSQLPIADRTDIEEAAKKILGLQVIEEQTLKAGRKVKALSWKEFDPISTVRQYAEEKARGKGQIVRELSQYQALIDTNDTPLYGESQFFSPPIRKIMYNSKDPGSSELSRLFYLEGLKPTDPKGGYHAEYIIQYYDHFNKVLTEYRLRIRNIILRLFSVGVMMLSIHTENVEVRQLKKNEKDEKDEWEAVEKSKLPSVEQVFCNCGSIGRRMYQPYIEAQSNRCIEAAVFSGIRFYHREVAGKAEKTDQTKQRENGNQSTESDKDVPDKCIPICYNAEAHPLAPDKCRQWGLYEWQIPDSRKEGHRKFAHPNSLCFLEELFPGACISFNRWNETFDSDRSETPIIITPFHDDRMYLHGYYVDPSPDGIPNQMKKDYPLREELLKPGSTCHCQDALKKWYAVSQMDRNCSESCTDLEMIRQQIERDTYSRWVGWGTVYALTSTNCLMVLNSSDEQYLITNMQWHYFQLFLIALLQRCSTLRFYEEAAAIMNQSVQNKDIPELCDSLRSQYIIFLNSVWWKEVSLQIQGQEMYRMLSANMEIDDNVKQLDEALSELYEYNEGVYQKKISSAMNLFAVVGSVWAIIELLAFIHKGVTGAEYPNLKVISNFCLNFCGKAGDFILWLLVSGIITCLLYWSINKKKSLFKRKGRKYSRRRK